MQAESFIETAWHVAKLGPSLVIGGTPCGLLNIPNYTMYVTRLWKSNLQLVRKLCEARTDTPSATATMAFRG